MSSYFDQIEQAMGDALERRFARKPRHVRWLGRIRRHPGPAVLLATLVVAAPAVGAATHWYGLNNTSPFVAQGSLDAAGNPQVAMMSLPDGTPQAAIRWVRCLPGAHRCDPVATPDGVGDPGPQPAGTVFRASAHWHGERFSTSLRWLGAVRSASPPSLAGPMRVGARVTVGAAQWTGGWVKGMWTTRQDNLGIEACRTAHATGCVMLTGVAVECYHVDSRSGCGSLGSLAGTISAADFAQIGNWYTGWYLFGLDARLNGTSGALGFQSEAAIHPWPTNRIVIRSRPYGPITGPPRPSVTILPRARTDGTHAFVAIVRCATRCPVSVSVTLRHPAPTATRTMWTAEQSVVGTNQVGVPAKLPQGGLTVRVEVGNGPYVNGRSAAR